MASTSQSSPKREAIAESPSLPQAVWCDEPELRISLARVIQLDALSRQAIPLRSVWCHLASGAWRARNSFQTDNRFYFVLQPRSERNPTPRPTAVQVAMLQRALLSERQKVMAYDTAKSNSTVATRLASCLSAMGFVPRASRVPALLVATVAAVNERTQIGDARYSTVEQDGMLQVIVSTPRLDSFLAPLLTREEFQVARLLVEGMTYLEIALNRASAVRTVANHISSIFRKLGVSGRAELLWFVVLNFRPPITSESREADSSHDAQLALPEQREVSSSNPFPTAVRRPR